ncbi:SDR family NAD(P)-dependent oxidoreductase [Acuticoccus sediminis]|uniref:SDR family NAD(P)-dependent oxidoreductase n=1 Tax=Acuticoccus sediminis TaxID=2184697 RepID=UPI001CFF2D96|nr:SDR family oxidoreductase [Acuticoccus sediminis]
MNLHQARVAVLGGTGGVGEGIVRAFLKRGARVAVPSRSQAKLERLRAYVDDIKTGQLVTLSGELSHPKAASELRDDVQEQIGTLDVTVASLGGWTQGFPIRQVPFESWERILRDNLTSHFLAMQAFMPLLSPGGGAYVHVNGLTAEQAYPGAGPVAAMAAAQKSLALTLAEEVRPLGLRAHEVILPPVNTRTRVQHGHGRPEWPSAEEVGDFIVELLERQDPVVLHRLPPKQSE